MNNPTFLTLFSLVFILLGSYNVFTGSKRIREARARGVSLSWYKQINILTGVEYILLALVFIVSSANRNNAVPKSFEVIIVPLYIVLLLAAAILAGLVIRQGIINARTIRAQSRTSSTIKSNGTSTIAKQVGDEEDTEQQVANLERRRERRRNAAAARRRRAGKA
jgi:cytochrome bd-type quinol oxidase subunit 2